MPSYLHHHSLGISSMMTFVCWTITPNFPRFLPAAVMVKIDRAKDSIIDIDTHGMVSPYLKAMG